MHKWVLMDISGIFTVPGTTDGKPGIIFPVDVDPNRAGVRLDSGLFCGQGIASSFLPSPGKFSFTQSVILEGCKWCQLHGNTGPCVLGLTKDPPSPLLPWQPPGLGLNLSLNVMRCGKSVAQSFLFQTKPGRFGDKVTGGGGEIFRLEQFLPFPKVLGGKGQTLGSGRL